MCGICGLSFEDKKLIRAMSDTIRHRGPDEGVYFFDKGISLGMRRLAIIDLTKGIYPLHDENDELFCVFNGEIYNYLELRAGLEARGHSFCTDCDGEVIVHLYEDHGRDCLKFLNGIFAIALWDTNKKELMLARDRLGIKPLYYTYQNKRLAFCSEAKSLLLLPGIEKKINYNALHCYLSFRCNSTSETMFGGIFKLPPGHCMVYSQSKSSIRIESYWDFSISSELDNEKAVESELYARLRKAVKMQLMSDVPLGVYLSGGIDSAGMVALISKMSEEPVKTYSVAFTDDREKELAGARLVAEMFRTDHHEIEVEIDSVKVLPSVIWHEDEPLCDPAAIPVNLLSEKTKPSATVVLTGDGSDEQFAGYEQFRFMMLRKRLSGILPSPLRKAMPPLAGLVPKQMLNRLFKYSGALGKEGLKRFGDYISSDSPADAYLSLVSIFNEEEKNRLYTAEAGSAIDRGAYLRSISAYFREKTNHLNQVMRLDLDKMLAEDILMKTDKNSMAWSIEARVPYLDHTLWEFSMRINPGLKLHGRTDKYILRKTLRRVLPRIITNRPKDRFFVPIDHWLSGDLQELAKQLLSKEELSKAGAFRQEQIEKIFRGYKESRLYYARQLWSLLTFQLWHKIYFERDWTKKSSRVF